MNKSATSMVVIVTLFLLADAGLATDSSTIALEKTLALRKVWPSANDTSGTINPDGNAISYVDWDTGDLAVRDLVTGQNRRLTNKGTWDDNSQFAEASCYSPDGKQLAYSWFDGERNYQLRVIALDDAKPRVLMTNSWLWPTDWSGDSIAVVASSTNRSNDMVVVSVRDQTVRVLNSLGRRELGQLFFSPDAQFLAYSCRTTEDRRSYFDVWVHELSTGKEYPVIAHPADDKLVGWTRNGRGLLVASDRRGGVDLWHVPWSADKTAGEWTIVKPDVGEISSMGFSRAGVLHYGNYFQITDLYVASVDFDAGTIRSPVSEISSRYIKAKRQLSLSPSGRSLAHMQGAFPQRTFAIQDLTTGESREFPSVPMTAPTNPLFAWSENDENLVFRARNPQNAIHLLNRPSGELTIVQSAATNANTTFWGTQFRQDQLRYFSWQPSQQKLLWITHSLKTGEKVEQEIHGVSARSADGFAFNPAGFTLSEDGKKLFYSRREKTDSGETNFVGLVRQFPGGSDLEVLRSTNNVELTAASKTGELLAILLRPPRRGQQQTVRIFELGENATKEKFTLDLPRDSRLLSGWFGSPPVLLLERRASTNQSGATPSVLCTISAATGVIKETDLRIKRGSIVGANPDGRVFIQNTRSIGSVWAMENFMTEITSATQ